MTHRMSQGGSVIPPLVLLLAACRAPGSPTAPPSPTDATETRPATAARKLDAAPLEKILGLQAVVIDAESVVKFNLPRSDVRITVDDFAMPPFMGLTSWAAFHSGGSAEAMVMGDLVLFEDEVNSVMSELFEAGLEVTALHNHFFFSDPNVFFMHIGGEGNPNDLAKGVRRAFDRVRAIRAQAPRPATHFATRPVPSFSALNAGALEDIVGAKPQSKDGMVKFVIGRTARAACGCEVGKEMGVNTWAAFAGTENDAVIDGDFCVLETELQTVLRTLRRNSLSIVAIHHHMVGETPRYIFLHYWGRGPARDLARAFAAGLKAVGAPP